MKYLLPTLLFFLFLPSLVFSSEEPCYVSVKTSKEFNTVLVSEISTSLISQYITEVKSIPPSGLSGEPSCIFEVSVTKDGEKTFVTLKGNNLNSFGDSLQDGTNGFQESILRSIYRSQRDKRDLICGDYGNILEECGGKVRLGKVKEKKLNQFQSFQLQRLSLSRLLKPKLSQRGNNTFPMDDTKLSRS